MQQLRGVLSDAKRTTAGARPSKIAAGRDSEDFRTFQSRHNPDIFLELKSGTTA
jgi:hypothetical protein